MNLYLSFRRSPFRLERGSGAQTRMKSSLRRVLNSPPRNLTKSPKSTPASPVELPSSAATHSGSGTAIPNQSVPLSSRFELLFFPLLFLTNS